MRKRTPHTIAVVAGLAGLTGLGLATSSPASASTPPTDDGAAVDCAAIEASFEGDDPGVLSTFVEAANSSSGEIGSAEPPFTVFMPVDAAFEVLPEGVLDAIFADADMLATMIDYHLLPGQNLDVADLAEAGSVATLTGESIDFALEGDTLVLNGGAASVVCPDLEVDDAVVHIIDGLLQSPSLAAGGSAGSTSVPGSSTPGSSVPAAAAFDDEQQAVATAWETVTDSSLTFDEQAPFIENAEALQATIEAYPTAADVVGGITSTVTSVTIDGDTASITYTLAFNGTEQPYGELPATLVNVDGTWTVPQTEYCSFQGQARNNCPA